jgi:hypothetical protein
MHGLCRACCDCELAEDGDILGEPDVMVNAEIAARVTRARPTAEPSAKPD